MRYEGKQMEIDNWPFEDADDFPDELLGASAWTDGATESERHLVRVVRFHRDLLNGGLNQVMYNLRVAAKEKVDDYARSFEELGLAPLATVIRLAARDVKDGTGWRSVFGRKPADLDAVYISIAYGGLPYACKDRLSDLQLRTAEGKERHIDWVARAALKYGRERRGDLTNFIEKCSGR